MGAGRDRGDVSRLVLHGWEGRRVPRAVNCTVGRLVDPKGGRDERMDGWKGVNVGNSGWAARGVSSKGGSHRSRVATADQPSFNRCECLELCRCGLGPGLVSRVVSQRQRWRGRWRALALGLKGWNALRRFFRGDWGY